MKRLAVGCALVVFAAGCSASAPEARPGASPISTAPVSASPQPTQSTTPPAFTGTAAPIDETVRARMRYSWRPGCPVALAELRLLRLSHRRFDGSVAIGELVVHRDAADSVIGVFRRLFETGFPIERMELVDVYGGDDGRSIAANNTSGFNCRRSTGDAASWSEHAYGRAIDINPVQNPYVARSGAVQPEAGTRYTDRKRSLPGMILPGDEAVSAFGAIGWSWGGNWTSAKDYQHFSSTGR